MHKVIRHIGNKVIAHKGAKTSGGGNHDDGQGNQRTVQIFTFRQEFAEVFLELFTTGCRSGLQ